MPSKKNKIAQRNSAKEKLESMKPNQYKVRVSASTPNFAGFIAPLIAISNVLDFSEVFAAFAPFLDKVKTTAIKGAKFTLVNLTTGLESESFPATDDRVKLARSFWKALEQAQWPSDANASEMAETTQCRYVTTLWNRRVNGRTGEIASVNVDLYDFKEVRKTESKVKRQMAQVATSKIAPTQLGQIWTKLQAASQAALEAPKTAKAIAAPSKKAAAPQPAVIDVQAQ